MMNILAFVAVGVLAFVAMILPQLPDLYYVGFQVVVFVVFGWACFKLLLAGGGGQNMMLGIGSAVIALFFNPIIHTFTDNFLGITRTGWIIADGLLILACAYAIFRLSKQK